MSQPSLLTALCHAPPALRSDIVRKALWGRRCLQDGGGNLFGAARGAVGLKSARGYRGVSRQSLFVLRQRSIIIACAGQRRLQSTTTADSISSSQQHPPKKSRAVRFLTTTALALFACSAAFAMSAAPAAEAVNGYVNPPTDAETLDLYTPPTPSAAEIDDKILHHPLAEKLRADPNFTESRPSMRIPPAMRPHNLTAGVLAGADKIEVPPLNFNEKGAELPSMVQIMYLGPALCGHPGIVHGGLLATMLDEGLARACFPALPNKIGVTASLKIDYRNPCPAGSYVVLKAYTTKVEGRKAWVHGWVELLGEEDGSGSKVVEAEALFIEPKNSKHMARNIVASDS